MKRKLLYFSVLLLVIGFSSCSKQQLEEISGPSIVGKWRSVAVYTQNGAQFEWQPVNVYPEFVTFQANARFSIFRDVQGGSGQYQYDTPQQSILFHYEDQAGNITSTQNSKVEQLTGSKMIAAYYDPAGALIYKTEYSRIP